MRSLFDKKNNVVEILYTDTCPFWKETLNTINQVMKELNITIPIQKARIANEEEAKRLKFPGSPTVRLNGVDIDCRQRNCWIHRL